MTLDPKGGLDFEAPIGELERKIDELETFAKTTEMDLSGQIAQLKARCLELTRDVFENLTAWQKIQIARHPQRPVFSDYLAGMFEDAVELHGDRRFGDDKAIWTGLATIPGTPGGAEPVTEKRRVLVIGQRKGRNTKERIAFNFGCAHPEGYRKALHKMKLAEKFGLPVVTFIDTPGAYPGVGAEERGQAHAIAENIRAMSRLRTPVVCVVIGEGGSGGALAIGVGDRILMLEHAYYSVISPEGCSSILWKTAEQANKAAEALKLTAKDLFGFGVIDEIIQEPVGGAHRCPADAVKSVREAILASLALFDGKSADEVVAARYEKVRRLGIFLERPPGAIVEEPAVVPEAALAESDGGDSDDGEGEGEGVEHVSPIELDVEIP